MTTALGFGYAALIVYLANAAALGTFRQDVLRWLLLGLCLLLGLIGLNMLGEAHDPLSLVAMLTVLAGAVTGGLFISWDGTRQQLRRWLPASASYQPDSIVHTTAIVLLLFQSLFTLATFQLAGGQAGLAALLAAQPPALSDAVFSAAVYGMMALGGVGLFTRRNGPQALARLGLNAPSARHVLIGVVVALSLQALTITFTALWLAVTPPVLVQQQQAAGNAFALAFTGSALVIVLTAAAAALGEEVLYRGAIQPVFGLALTTLMFTLLHTQYLGSPTLLLIALVGLAFGWLRQRYNTVTAITAHFVFNLLSLTLAAQGV